MTENLNLFANSSSVPIVISASQGESNARSFKIQIVGTDNLPIDLEGSTTSLYILVDPETEIQIPGIVEGTYVTFTLTYNSTLTAGKHECWIQIIKPNDSDLRIDNLTLYVQKCNIDALAEQSPEFGTLTQLITEAQEAIANANEAAEEASSTASTTATNVVNQQKAQPNGLATLDSSGKLVQMPTAADVGARASDWLPSAAEIEAVPASEKGTANGVATLDGSGKLVQMPTATDVGLSEVNNEFTQGLVSSSSPTRQLGYIWSGTVRALFQTFSLPVPSSGWSQIGTSGIYVVDTEVNWSFGWPFVSKPVVLLQPSGINYRLIQVKVGNHDQNGISSVQLYSYTDSFAGPASVMAIIFGEVDSHSQ